MMKLSEAEQHTKLQAQLFTLDKQYGVNLEMIKIIGDLLPGVVLVNDMRTMKNAYMNRMGCDYLRKSAEELELMGPEYFVDEIFCPKEVSLITHTFKGVIERDDVAETMGFYQKVRPNKQTHWGRFYLSGKLLERNTGQTIMLGMAAAAHNNVLNQVEKILDIESPSPVQFQQFSSLTKREKQVLRLISQGLSNANISDLLYLAPYTIETHRKNINRKLGTKNIRELILIAQRFGL
ncbi:LuxR family transcriptional regulator [Mucilaginibacter conchicola]|uniref:LuxR family transcriptional regulator n=1 Tax=Mucilaginibacter conchicola TaxID=2303333 RepID=A0A372NMX4_9SPHI|nr:helix-turn-helix transcriptional regulator [Mucilaginibacter conchicola]RFZ90294.1 LuxR family transcriptional regulator [Mucilaginibacter conchicola]